MACACSTGAAAAWRRPRPAASSTASPRGCSPLQDEAQALLAGEQALTRGHLRIAADSAHHVVPIMAALRKRAERPHLRAVDRQFRGRAGAPAAPRGRRRGDGQERLRPAAACRAAAHRPARAVRAGPPSARPARPRGARRRSPARSWCCASAARSRAKCLKQAMAAADIRPGAIVEVQTREGVREAVAAGFGIGAVFASELGEDRRFRRILVTDSRSQRRRICRVPAGAPPRGAGAGLHGRGDAAAPRHKFVKKLSSTSGEA